MFRPRAGTCWRATCVRPGCAVRPNARTALQGWPAARGTRERGGHAGRTTRGRGARSARRRAFHLVRMRQRRGGKRSAHRDADTGVSAQTRSKFGQLWAACVFVCEPLPRLHRPHTGRESCSQLSQLSNTPRSRDRLSRTFHRPHTGRESCSQLSQLSNTPRSHDRLSRTLHRPHTCRESLSPRMTLPRPSPAPLARTLPHIIKVGDERDARRRRGGGCACERRG